MLIQPEITAFLPTIKPTESKSFYTNILGLTLIAEDDYAIEFQGPDVRLRITIVQAFNPHPFTVLGFRIKEIEAQVSNLIEKGVKFERFSALDQTELGIWTSPINAKVAWLKDPDGNLISLTQLSATTNLE